MSDDYADKLADMVEIHDVEQPTDDIIIAVQKREANQNISAFSSSVWRVVAHIPKDGGHVWIFGRSQ